MWTTTCTKWTQLFYPLTSAVFVLIKTRCGENDCREERSTWSDKHKHAHTCTHTIIGESIFRRQQPATATTQELTHAESQPNFLSDWTSLIAGDISGQGNNLQLQEVRVSRLQHHLFGLLLILFSARFFTAISHKAGCYVMLGQPININHLHLDSSGILRVARPMQAGRESLFQEKLSEIIISISRCAEANEGKCMLVGITWI